MLSFHNGLKIFVAVQPCDMRKSFNSLHGLILDELNEDPQSGALFIFANKRRNRLKIFYFDGSGTWVMARRLEQGTFSWPFPADEGEYKVSLSPEALQLLLDGVDLKRGSLRPWYRK